MTNSHDEHIRAYDDSAEAELRSSGRVPLSLSIGVVGHRDLAEPAAALEAVRRALSWLVTALDLEGVSVHTPLALHLVSPCAPGADRIVVRAVEQLRLGAVRLVVPVPHDLAWYRKLLGDEPEARSTGLPIGPRDRAAGLETPSVEALERTSLDDWMGREDATVQVVTRSKGEIGLREIGEWVLDHSDVLVALWDGGQAPPPKGSVPSPGTAAIVAEALAHPREIPVLVVPVRRRSGTGDTVADTARLLVRHEPANPFIAGWWWAAVRRRRRPRRNVPQLSGWAEAALRQTIAGAPTDHAHQDAGRLRGRQRGFERWVTSWSLDGPSASRVLSHHPVGQLVHQVGRFNAGSYSNPGHSQGWVSGSPSRETHDGSTDLPLTAGEGEHTNLQERARAVRAWGG